MVHQSSGRARACRPSGEGIVRHACRAYPRWTSGPRGTRRGGVTLRYLLRQLGENVGVLVDETLEGWLALNRGR
jgi:hypothetical protein